MNKELVRQLKNVEKEEAKFLNKKENRFMKNRIDPLTDQLLQKIPKKLTYTLESAFVKSFQLLYEKGDGLIGRTFNKDQRQMDHKILNYALDQDSNRRYIKQMDKQVQQSKLLNTSFSVLEGGVLGFLGIGLPDIPVFIGVVLRNVYEVALSYGYDFDSAEEKFYILGLIDAAMAQGVRKVRHNERLDVLGGYLDEGRPLKFDMKRQMDITAKTLADAMLVAKFIQGIPVVGTVGGVVNYNIIRKISQYAAIKYKKRYLLSKFQKSSTQT